MEQAQIEHFRQLLTDLRREMLSAEETGSKAEQAVELDQTRVGRLSRMDAMQGQAMSKETGRRRRALLIDINRALARCEDGSYGECLECGENINPKRLEAAPANPHCIACAEALE